ncbi:MAG: TetR/AcrR family transcriptional regulator [Clostridia bacterium]|nr:TetR/AcrR family transcriptional regulator [Clostridia bacterium]
MKKELILSKALDLFATKGYFGTSMEDIAQAVGIKKASLYSHYAGKENIFSAVFDSILEDYGRFINTLTTLDHPENSLEKLCKIFSGYIKNCRNNMKMVFWDRYYYYPPEYLKDYIQQKTYEVEMDLIDKIQKIIEAGIRENEIKSIPASDIALAFYNMMIGFAMGIKFYDERGIDKDISRCSAVFIEGIKHNSDEP